MRESETFEQTMDRQEQKIAHGNMYNHMHCCAEGLGLQCLSSYINGLTMEFRKAKCMELL